MLVAACIFIGWAFVLLIFTGASTSLGTAIFNASPSALNSLQAGVQRYIFPDIWDWVFQPVLELPAWLPPLVFGGLLLVARSIQKARSF